MTTMLHNHALLQPGTNIPFTLPHILFPREKNALYIQKDIKVYITASSTDHAQSTSTWFQII